MTERERMEKALEEPWVFPRDASVDECSAFRNGYLSGLKRAEEVARYEGDNHYALRNLAAIIKELEGA